MMHFLLIFLFRCKMQQTLMAAKFLSLKKPLKNKGVFFVRLGTITATQGMIQFGVLRIGQQ